MPDPLISVTRQQFIQNLAQARQVHVTQLPPWAQSGVVAGWIFPQFNENLALIFDLGRYGLAITLPAVVETLTEVYDTLREWIVGRGWSSEEDLADAIEEWATEAEYPGSVWAEA